MKKGFTLIELLVVVIIITILSAVGYGTFKDAHAKKQRLEQPLEQPVEQLVTTQVNQFTSKTLYSVSRKYFNDIDFMIVTVNGCQYLVSSIGHEAISTTHLVECVKCYKRTHPVSLEKGEANN